MISGSFFFYFIFSWPWISVAMITFALYSIVVFVYRLTAKHEDNFTKRKVVIGITLSYIVFLIYTSIAAFFFVTIGAGLAMGGSSPSVDFTVSILFFLMTIGLLGPNSVLHLIFRKSEVRKGIQIGYVFPILLILFIIFSIGFEKLEHERLIKFENQIRAAIERNDSSLCTEKNFQKYYDDKTSKKRAKGCIEEIAIRSNNVLECNKIGNVFSDHVECYVKVSKKLGNTSICDIAPTTSEKNFCLFKMTAFMHNPSLCDAINFNDPGFLQLIAKEDPRKASHDFAHDDCYYDYRASFEQKDFWERFCPKVQTTFYKEQCSQQGYFTNMTNIVWWSFWWEYNNHTYSIEYPYGWYVDKGDSSILLRVNNNKIIARPLSAQKQEDCNNPGYEKCVIKNGFIIITDSKDESFHKFFNAFVDKNSFSPS